MTPADLPEAFIAKLREYLGVVPANFVEGVLQDVHWSDSSFGYFPTYALGNVISVQLWERATDELGDLDGEFERGEFASLREWLREHVHRWGRASSRRIWSTGWSAGHWTRWRTLPRPGTSRRSTVWKGTAMPHQT